MGRLVDANLLTKQFMSRYTEREKQGNYTFVACEIKSDFRDMMDEMPTVDAVPVVHGYWDDGMCSVCKEEAFSTSWDEPIYDYDWEENLEFSHIETHEEYHLTDFCPNCGAKMDLERKKM